LPHKKLALSEVLFIHAKYFSCKLQLGCCRLLTALQLLALLPKLEQRFYSILGQKVSRYRKIREKLSRKK
jgi:hypothetical protein